MIPYWVLFAVFALGAVTHRQDAGTRVSTPLIWLAALLMAAMIGLRYEVGPDWIGYSSIFEGFRRQKLGTVISHGDPGFTALVWLIRRLGLEIWAVNSVCAMIFTTGLFVFARQQRSPWLAITVAVPYLVIVIAMSATRQATAIGLIMLGLAAFANKSPFRFVFWIFVASLFHASALLMLPIVGLSYTKNRFQTVLLLCAAAIPAYYLLATNFEIYIERYTNKFTQSEGAAYRVIMNAFPAIIFLLLRNRFGEVHQRTLWRNFSILALLCVPLLALFPSSTALDRVALYIIPLQIYVLGNLPGVLATAKRGYLAMVLGIIGYLALIQLVYLNFSTHGEYYLPYQFYPIS